MRTREYILAGILAIVTAVSCERWPDRQVFEGSGLGAVTKYYEISDAAIEFNVDVIATMQYDIINNADWISVPSTSQARDGFSIRCEKNSGLTRIATIILAIEHMNHYDTVTVRQNGITSIKLLNGSEEGTAVIDLNNGSESYELQVKYLGSQKDWITAYEVVDDKISFTYQKNETPEPRTASFIVTYNDADSGIKLTHGLDVLQYSSNDTHEPVYESVTDLTADGRYANCYILTESAATVYSFDARHVSGGIISNAARTAEILWETAQGTVVAPVYDPIANRIYVAKPSGAKGNAVLALKDNGDKILWSFHLWVPGEEMSDVSIGGVTFMDRNIGAVTCKAPAGNENSSVGMHYQWGRKDPFPPAKDLSQVEGKQSVVYPSDAIRYIPAEEGHTGKSLSYAIENPTTFIWGSGANGIEDWSEVRNDNYWSSTAKTDYDPCPYGYIVPSMEQLKAVTDRWASNNTSSNASKGRNINCDDNTTNFWVKAGWYRRTYHAESQFANVTNHGYYWTSTTGKYADNTAARGAYASQSSGIDVWVRRWGANVRCVKAIKTE